MGFSLNSLLMDFSGFFYEDVIMAKDYGYATICTLCDRLANKGHSGSLFMEMYLFHWGEKGVKDEHRYIEVTPDILKKAKLDFPNLVCITFKKLEGMDTILA